MKYIDEYRNSDLVAKIADLIKRNSFRNYIFMEVCGGHSAAIHRFGIPSLLPDGIKLISGPGCPVCVTGTDFIDKSVALAQIDGTIITTFGDMIRVPGTASSLEYEKSSGKDIRVVLSAGEALKTAIQNPSRKVVFLAIGFETTAPGTAVTIREAGKSKTGNFFVLCGHKVMPPAMKALLDEGSEIDGFICPGHVAAITGSGIFRFIPENHNIACVVSGFEPTDILLSVLMLINQVNKKSPAVEIQYKRAVSETGNSIALKLMDEVFEPADVTWRGLGVIRSGGLKLRPEYKFMDAEESFPLNIIPGKHDGRCICGEILRGVKTPADCDYFGKTCLPENPVGACMVSSEGSCNVWYRYKTL